MNLSTRGFRYVLSAFSGILLLISFPKTGSLFPLVFVALVPLLLVSNQLKSVNSWHFFGHSYLAFFIYNFGCTYWVYNASPGGGLMAFFCNSLLYALFLVLFQRINRRGSAPFMPLILCSVFLFFEFLHLNWDLSWPWLHLGNMFASVPQLVQWYSFTGILGGSLWVLLLNSLITQQIIAYSKGRNKYIALVLLVPCSVSLVLYFTKDTGKPSYEVVLLQPNVDPYEKFQNDDAKQFEDLIALANKKVTTKTKLVVGPETSFFPNAYGDFVHDKMNETNVPKYVKQRTKNWENAQLFLGISTLQFYTKKRSSVTRFDDLSGKFYEYYNASIYFGKDSLQLVKKSKRVLGVELIPFADWLPFLENLSISLGGSSGTLGIEEGYKIIHGSSAKFTPCVCYESVYGEFVSKQTKLGASFICVITNDGWWGDTPGYRQHFEFARLRAIENNRYVVRSGNTGISGFINNRGDVLQKTNYWEKDVIRKQIPLLHSTTIYMILGDFIGWIAAVLSFILLLRFWKI